MSKNGEINILLVEDTEEHALLIRRGLEEGMLRYRLFHVRDGEEALDFLYNRGEYGDEKNYPTPNVILLDLRLPRLSGLEVLQQLQREERLKHIPVVVITVSEEVPDIRVCCRAAVCSYLLKSAAFAPKEAGVPGIIDAIVSICSTKPA